MNLEVLNPLLFWNSLRISVNFLIYIWEKLPMKPSNPGLVCVCVCVSVCLSVVFKL